MEWFGLLAGREWLGTYYSHMSWLAGRHIVEKITQHIINGMRKITKQDNFDSWFSFHNFMSWLSLSRRADFYEDRKAIPTSCIKCDISLLVISKCWDLQNKYFIVYHCSPICDSICKIHAAKILAPSQEFCLSKGFQRHLKTYMSVSSQAPFAVV